MCSPFWNTGLILIYAEEVLIGDAGIHFLDPENMQCEIGYTIAKKYQGNGFGREAVSGIIEYLFTKLHKHRITASVDPENTASIRLLEKLGFSKEEIWKDDVQYGLLEEEWGQGKGI